MIETVKVKPWSKDQGEYVTINKCDFNDEIHNLYVVNADTGEDNSAQQANDNQNVSTPKKRATRRKAKEV